MQWDLLPMGLFYSVRFMALKNLFGSLFKITPLKTCDIIKYHKLPQSTDM